MERQKETVQISGCALQLDGAMKAQLFLLPSDRIALGWKNDRLVLGNPEIPLGWFFQEDEKIFLEAALEASILVNAQPLTEARRLRQGDWIVVEGKAMQVRLPQEKSHEGENAGGVQEGSAKQDIAQDILIGRLPDCGLVIDSPTVSRHHARLFCKGGIWHLEDLQSTNGTFVNGERLFSPVALRPKDRVQIASSAFVFDGTRLLSQDEAGLAITARSLDVTVRDRQIGSAKKILQDVDLVIQPGEFVAIFGTSGSGKSTLLDILASRRSPTSGTVFYAGVDARKSLSAYRSAIGYVPQQDIVHRKIQVADALFYTAFLRLPKDTQEEEARTRVLQVLEDVQMADKANLAVDTPKPLSGGQLKRINLATELVARPKALFLDEVTSGLDAGTDRKMMELFRNLAKKGTTVLAVTHTLENIEYCDLVVLLHQGRVVYVGPPGEAAEKHFKIKKLSDVYERLEEQSAEAWQKIFLDSPLYETYVQKRLAGDRPLGESHGHAAEKPKDPRFDFRQFKTLFRRNLDLFRADPKGLLLFLLPVPILGLMTSLVFESKTNLFPAKVASQMHVSFVLVLAAFLLGALNAVREIVKELPIYIRERAVNLGLGPYVAAKLLPLLMLCAIQCALLLAGAQLGNPLSGSLLKMFIALFSCSFAAVCLGLLVSASVNTSDKALAIAPLLVIPQVVLAGVFVPLEGITKVLAKTLIAAYWAFDAIKASFPAAWRTPPLAGQRALVEVSGYYWLDILALLVMGGAALALVLLVLAAKDKSQ